jgi:thiol-disulfide isomerase/thioredoxin
MKAPRPRLSRRALLMATGLAASAVSQAAPLDADDQAPDELGTGPDGRAMRRSDSPNTIHVVCFWATWCPYCKSALPVLEGLQRRLGPDVLRTVLITTEERDVYRQLVRLGKDLQLRFARDADKAVNTAWGSPKGVPYLAVVDHTGLVLGVGSGWGESSTDWLVRSVNKGIQTRNKAMAAPAT